MSSLNRVGILKRHGEPTHLLSSFQTHYRAIFTLSNNILVTLTLQTPESRYGEMKQTFDLMVDSFGKYEG